MLKAMVQRLADVEGLKAQLVQLRDDVSRIQTAPPQPYDDGEVWSAMGELEDRIKRLTIAIEEGIERVDRSERRVRAVVQRARKELEESGVQHGGLEAEAGQLQLIDERGGRGEGMHPVPEGVANPPRPDLSSFPGQWGDAEVAQLLRGRGLA